MWKWIYTHVLRVYSFESSLSLSLHSVCTCAHTSWCWRAQMLGFTLGSQLLQGPEKNMQKPTASTSPVHIIHIPHVCVFIRSILYIAVEPCYCSRKAWPVGASGQRGIHALCFKLGAGSQRESQRLRTGWDSSTLRWRFTLYGFSIYNCDMYTYVYIYIGIYRYI